MAPPTESPLCHQLRMPYEISKPILARLNQKDQISVSKTCIVLWQLAYPMAYHRITVQIGPKRKESEWRHLASGVGLRYVRYLEIRSLYEDEDKPRYVEDLVAGTLIASVRRNQLLSFKYTLPVSSSSSLSVKTAVILIETQRYMERAHLPQIHGFSTPRLDDFLPTGSASFRLCHLTFAVTSCPTYIGHLYSLIRRSPQLKQLHAQGSCHSNDSEPHSSSLSRSSQQPRLSLLALATRLTINGYMFSRNMYNLRDASFPALRDLAVVGCYDASNLYRYLNPKWLPKLDAFMGTGGDLGLDDSYWDFIREMSTLRELILDAPHVELNDIATLALHSDTLELLYFRRQGPSREMSPFSNAHRDMETLFSSPTALRHLRICVARGTLLLRQNGKLIYIPALLKPGFETVMACKSLQTLHVGCTTTLYVKISNLEQQDSSWPKACTVFEEAIYRHFIKLLNEGFDVPWAGLPLDYMAVTNSLGIIPLGNPLPQSPPLGQPKLEKHILSFQPVIKRRPASQLKEEMMATYAKDNYYFLEDYVDAMMEPSTCTLNT